MTTTMTKKRTRKPQMSRSRTSAPMLSDDAVLTLNEIGESLGGLKIPTLLAQLGEAAKHGKPENWHRAVAAFQDAIEK